MHDFGTIDEVTGKPDIVLDYNRTKGGVDTVDQLGGAYSVARVTRRWPLVIFYALMDIAGINAQIIFHANEANPKKMRRIFLKDLALSLMKPQLVERAAIPSLPVDIATFLEKYKEQRVEITEEPTTKKRGRCVTCGRARNTSTTIRCNSCHSFVCKGHVKTVHTCEKCNALPENTQDK